MINWGNASQMQWSSKYLEARWWIDDNGRDVLCRVSYEAIKDNCNNPESKEACFKAAREHFDHIVDRVERKMTYSNYEEDGSVLLRSSDW
jgi:hypothetical protein